MKINNYLLFTFASSTIVLLCSGKDANASLKQKYKQTSSCSYKTAIFKGKPFKSAFSNSTISPRYCITPGKQIIKYYGPDSSGEILKGKLGEQEIYWNDFHSSFYLNEFEINGDKLISYSCATSNSTDCSGIPKRYVVGTKINKKNNNISKKLKEGERIINLEGGDQYIGRLLYGKYHGKGTYIWASGDYYVGYWENGLRNGKGKMKYSDGDSYEGGWFNGYPHGTGTYTWAKGGFYRGNWINGKRHGKGIMKWANGDFYEGDFFAGKKHGKGTYTWVGGTYYEGDYLNGLRTGYGKFRYASSGRVLKGRFRDGEFLGQ